MQRYLVSLSSLFFVLGSCSSAGQEQQETCVLVDQGETSRYLPSLDGNPTASGDIYVHQGVSGAHRTLPFGTYKVVPESAVEPSEGIDVNINDRGPFVTEGKQGTPRVLDLSGGAADILGFEGTMDIRIYDCP